MKICSQHNISAKWIPPGKSKRTGKPYNGFWACPEYNCKAELIDDIPEEEISDEQIVSEVGSMEENIHMPVEENEPIREPLPEEDNNIWAAKDRTSMYQTCLKAASEVVAAQIAANLYQGDPVMKIKSMAHDFYLDMLDHRKDMAPPF